MRPCSRKQPCGATLVECLVILTIITLLVTLTAPAFQRLFQSTKRIVCQTNLHQWGLATHFFTADHEGYLPTDGAPNGRSIQHGWYVQLPPQIDLSPYHQAPWRTNSEIRLPRTTWLCPGNSRRSNGFNLFHYCLNQHINGRGAGNQIRIETLPSPGKLVWLFDNQGFAAVAQQNNLHTHLHSNGANILFLDGHVRHQAFGAPPSGRRDVDSVDEARLVWKP